MKKLILIIILLSTLTGCEQKENEIINNQNEVPNINESEIDTYQDNNPIKVSLYQKKNKVKSYETTLANFKDIAVFNIYYTDIDTLDSSNIKNNYKKYYDQYQDISNYKTGFYISFQAEGKEISELILDPSKKHAMTPYLYIYLYDDINQKDGTYYSHLEPIDMKDETIISSIKLFLAQEGSKITSPITLTVFTYDEDDFTEDNKYRGISSYTITIDLK